MKKKRTLVTPQSVIKKRRQQVLLRQEYLMLILRAIFFILAIYIFFTKILCFVRVEGTQMFPALKDGDLTLCYSLPQQYRSNDIIMYEQNGQNHFGRIISVGGNDVNIDGSGDVKINGISEGGEIVYSTYKKGSISYPYHVPQDSVFVLGDYRKETQDSRSYGAITKTQIKGKVLTILRRRGL